MSIGLIARRMGLWQISPPPSLCVSVIQFDWVIRYAYYEYPCWSGDAPIKMADGSIR
jgi:hypothetical protein